MAKHDDLDLIHLFGLSAEEASGLGLDLSAQPPRAGDLRARSSERRADAAPAAPGGLPVQAERSSPARPAGAQAAPLPPEGTPGLVAHTPAGSRATAHTREADGRMADELALLAMFGGSQTDTSKPLSAPDYSGHGASRGLSLVDTATPLSSPSEGAQPHADSDDADRFIWPADRRAEDDENVDVVSLFALTAEEATGLGLAPRVPVDDTLAPTDDTPHHARAGTVRATPAPTLPTMHLHAIDQDQRDELVTGTALDKSEGGRRESEVDGVPLPPSAVRLPPGQGQPKWDASPLPEQGERPVVRALPASDAPALPPTGRVRCAPHVGGGLQTLAGAEDASALDAEAPEAPALDAEAPDASALSADTPEAPADEKGHLVSASGAVEGHAPPADVTARPLQRAEVGTTPEAAVLVSSQPEAAVLVSSQSEAGAKDTLGPAVDRPALATPEDSSAASPELGVDPALLDAFAEESAELLDGLHVELEHLESDVDDQGALLETRRIIHTIKGGAKMCGFELVALLTHSCENLLDLIADGAAPLDGNNLRALFECEPLLRAVVQDAITGGGANLDGVATLAARFDAYCLAVGTSPATTAIDDVAPASETAAQGSTDVADASAQGSTDVADASAQGSTDVADASGEGPATVTAVSAARAAPAATPGTDTVGADAIHPFPGTGVAAVAADDAPAIAAESFAGSPGTGTRPVPGDPAPPRWQGGPPHDVGDPRSDGDPERPRWLRDAPHDVGDPRSGSERARGAPRGGRNANSINVDLSKVDAVVAKVTELAAHRVSSQGMIGQLLETSEDARRNVARLHSVAMQISNECTSILPEETTQDDLELERYNTLNTLVLQLQEAVSDQQALVQALHDTITGHWSLRASESRVDSDIQNALMSIRLVPLASLRVRLDGVVRQAAEATGKLVRWQLQGGSVAVEKNVFDRLFEPLMHLLRNAVDHGLETAAERRTAGKTEAGAIAVAAAQEGNHIVITVADDGRGIVANKVAALAVDRGLITPEQATSMTHQQKVGLIFTPGFSTATRVSHISGRGVGMDAVREACLRMGGTLDVSSRPGTGTTFTMRLPLSLSVTRGLIIRDGGCLMVLPVAQVVALHLVSAADVVEVPGGRVARIEGQELPIYNLPPLAGAVPAGYVQNGEVNVLQVAHAGGAIGVVIEDVLGEEEILIKAPPALLRGVKTLLGAYVLPDGRVAPVVNLPQLLADLRPVATLSAPRDERTSRELRALVVDDSMSMRVALSGTLQNAGFSVLTARDGQEALEVLKREGLPSLVTLDVEMPRMDGLETLFAIRQMAGAEELPVFMMTSRGGAKHRRAAEQLGATRYFTKPYRDSELATAARAACTDVLAS